MKVAIHQPQYWPWPPYLHKVMAAEVFVFLDTVQFSKNGLQNRNQIKTPQGTSWLTLPVKHHFEQTILETRIADGRATRKHFQTLSANYARTAGFQRWRDEISALLDTGNDSLCEVVIASTEWMLRKLGNQARLIRASEIPETEGAGSALVASICKALGATDYFTGTGALAYMSPQDFSQIKCKVWVQQWTAPVYQQVHPEAGFIADLSALDLILNSPDQAAQLIRSSGDWKLWDSV